MATAASVFRDFEVDGVPASGRHKPKKSEIRTLLKGYEDILSALGLADGFQGAWNASSGSFPSGAQKGYSWIVSTAGTVGGKYFGEGDQLVALVNGASTSTYAGNWVVIPAWTNGVVAGVDEGAGTANAIQITTEKPVSDDTIVVFTLDTSTTGSPVTVSINGGTDLTLKSNRGNNASALTAGMEIWGRIRSSDSTFRLLNDQDVSALVAQAEAALAEFEKRYLGAKASDPSVDNEGNALIEGALYWNSSLGKMRVYHLSAWEDFGSVPDGSVSVIKLAGDTLDLIDPLRGFNADGTTDDTANFAALETTITGHRIDGRGRRYRITGDIPAGNDYVNGYWTVTNYEGDLTVNIPFDRTSLPVSKEVLIFSPGHNSWPEDSGWYWQGRKCVGYSISDHVSGDEHQAVHQYGGDGYWNAPIPLWGVNSLSALGYWHEGGCCINGVEFALARRQSTTEHHLFRRNLGRYIEATDIITPVNGTTRFRIYRSDFDLGIIEGTTATFTVSATVGGQTISGTKTVLVGAPATLPSLFVEFENGGSNFTSSTKGGGKVTIKINDGTWSELKFGANSIGQALTDFDAGDDLFAMAPVLLGLEPIPSRKDGAAYLSFGGGGTNVGVARIGKLFGHSTEAIVEMAMEFHAADEAYGEPTIAVSRADENIVYVMMRSDTDTVAPAIAITTDAFATQPTITKITPGGGYMLDNPNPLVAVTGADGEEYVFVGSTGNRGGNNLPPLGWTKIPVYLLVATKTDLLTTGASAFRAYRIGEGDFYDYHTDDGPSGRSGFGVGTIINLENGKIEYLCGEHRPTEDPNIPLVTIASYEVDISRWVGGVKPALGQSVEQGSGGLLEYVGLTSDVAAGGTFAPERKVRSDLPDRYLGGVFVCPKTGWWEADVSVLYAGTGAFQNLGLWDNGTNTWYVAPALFDASDGAFWQFCRAKLPTGTDMEVSSKRLVYLRAGQSVSFRTATGTTAKASATSNRVTWRRV